MNILGRFLRRFWHRLPRIPEQAVPACKLPVSPHQNPFAFRRALLRGALARLKQTPLDRADSPGKPADRSGREHGTER